MTEVRGEIDQNVYIYLISGLFGVQAHPGVFENFKC